MQNENTNFKRVGDTGACFVVSERSASSKTSIVLYFFENKGFSILKIWRSIIT